MCCSQDAEIYGDDAIFIDFTDDFKVINASEKNIIVMRMYNKYYLAPPLQITYVDRLKPVKKIEDDEASKIYRTPGNFTSIENRSDVDMVLKHCGEHYIVVKAGSCGCFVNP